MTKKVKAISALMLSVLLFTACSKETNTGYPIIGTAAEEDIPAEPKTINHLTADENADIPSIPPFVGTAGELLTQEAAISISPDANSYYSYNLEYDHAYFTYVVPLYDRKASEGKSEYYNIDTQEALDEYNLYLKNKAVIYTVNAGDKLENGLICTDASTIYVFDNDQDRDSPALLCTEAAFSGELTLTGTIYCKQTESPIPDDGKGYLTFTADSDNGKVFDAYNPDSYYPRGRSYKITSTGETMPYGETFRLGHISDLSDEMAKLIENNEYTDVRITIKNIHLFYGDYGYTPSTVAEIVNIELI